MLHWVFRCIVCQLGGQVCQLFELSSGLVLSVKSFTFLDDSHAQRANELGAPGSPDRPAGASG